MAFDHKQYNKEYRIKHKHEWKIKYGETDKKWRLKNKDKIKLRLNEWKIKNSQRQKRLMQSAFANAKYPGIINADLVQMVYEDNIKQFGTLTCYLCLNPISFGKDSLDHKVSKTRGGTNEYSNLAIAHRSCNSKKRCLLLDEIGNVGQEFLDKIAERKKLKTIAIKERYYIKKRSVKVGA